MSTLSPVAYQAIVSQAQTHILRGGGIVPDAAGASDLEDIIAAVAAKHFEAAETEAFMTERCAPLAHDDLAREALWTLVNAYTAAAFTLGAAVGLQLHQPPAAVKGGRS